MKTILDYGAKTDGTIVTKYIQRAIDETSASGGGRVTIPAGVFNTGSLFLKDNIELFLSSGSILNFSDDCKDYSVVVSRWEGVQREVYSSCIYGENVKNIAITGFGTLNGNGQRWWDIFRNEPALLSYPRPKLISFDRCEHITLKDFSAINSPSWTINPILCQNITIDNVNIKNPANSPNTDGINPESSKHVRISNCNIDVGDDCIAIKSGTEDTEERVSCENITITNCTMLHGHGAIVLGSEMSGDIRNVLISNCIFQETDRGIRFKSRRGRGGVIEDIRVNNIIMDKVICPFVMNLYYFCGPKGDDKFVWDKSPYEITEETPKFQRVHFANITARNVQASAGFIYGLAEQYISEVSFSNVSIHLDPDGIPGVPAMMKGIGETTRQGFYLGFSKKIVFDQVIIENNEGPAFFTSDCEDIELTRCKGENDYALFT